jgi:hypothetical protein
MLYFDKFPTLKYNVDGSTNYRRTLTDITFRLKLREKIKQNMYSYYNVDVSDDDTMEILAEKYYGNPEYHWVIAIANDILDPQYDWPLNYATYTNYLINKYGSQANADSIIHHYEKTIKRTDRVTNEVSEITLEIQLAEYNALSAYSYRAIDLDNNTTVIEEVTKKAVTATEYEFNLNEAKRQKKIIKLEYLPQILDEFTDLVSGKELA